LRTLGDYLDLSPATISLVLNNAPGVRSIPQETRDRVIAAAKKFEYRPSFFARSLRRRQSFSVGVLVPELSDGYSVLVMNGIEEVLIEEGYFYFTASHRRKADLIEEAQRMHAEDIAANQAMGRHGATLMPNEGGVLTHCNAGALATAGYGTALGVIRAAVEQGKKIHVYADETRPFLQGSRLTAWELMKDGIPTTVISDNMAGAMMSKGKIGAIVVGADRIAANGDVANKIGTYTVAILAKEHNIPFYVAAPISTIDMACPDGGKIPIEQRNAREVTHIAGKQMVPDGVDIENPAFDVTPAKYVAAIITEKGIARAPYEQSLRALAAPESEVHP